MAKKPHIDLKWHGDNWDSATDKLIKHNVRKIRPRLIKVCGPPNRIAYKALLEDIRTAIRLSLNTCREINRSSSSAQIYNTLFYFKERPDVAFKYYNTCDAGTRNVIAANYPDGAIELEINPANPKLLMQGIEAAFSKLKKPSRNRPPGTSNQAMIQLAIKLTDAFSTHVGDPARLVNRIESNEYGRFHEFITLVLLAIPQELLETRRNAVNTADWIVRTGTDYFKEPEKFREQYPQFFTLRKEIHQFNVIKLEAWKSLFLNLGFGKFIYKLTLVRRIKFIKSKGGVYLHVTGV